MGCGSLLRELAVWWSSLFSLLYELWGKDLQFYVVIIANICELYVIIYIAMYQRGSSILSIHELMIEAHDIP
jgi:hypothetical protein